MDSDIIALLRHPPSITVTVIEHVSQTDRLGRPHRPQFLSITSNLLMSPDRRYSVVMLRHLHVTRPVQQ